MQVHRQLSEQLERWRGSTVVILGIGNTLKGDDGAGPLLCEQLAGRVSSQVIDTGTVPENYIQPIVTTRPDHLIIVDAVDFGAAPGTVRLFQPQDINSVAFSTHALSPRLFLDVLRRETGADICLIGIQPGHTELGQPVCPAVQESVRMLADLMAGIFPRA